MLLNRGNWAPNRPWLYFCLLVFALASGWYFASAGGAGAWPGGGSLPGFTFGVAGGLICLFEFLLWLRKRVRVWRVGRTQVWMRAHIWLGLLCVPLLVYHSGFRFGGNLSTALMVLLVVVVVSGIWGLVMQQVLPQRMLDEIPAETIYSQIERLSAQLADEAERLVLATCGPAPGEEVPTPGQPDGTLGAAHVVVGAVRKAGAVQGKILETRTPKAPIPDAEPLRVFLRETLRPYLLAGERSGSPLGVPNQVGWLFQDLRTRLPPAAHGPVEVLENMAEQRRQWDRQARMHFWLHNWLLLHFPLSVALIVLMFVHVYVALKYW